MCSGRTSCQVRACLPDYLLSIENKYFDTLVPEEDSQASDTVALYEVEFRGNRKEFFRNSKGLELNLGDCVIVSTDGGYDAGWIYAKPHLVQIKSKVLNIDPNSDELFEIDHLASKEEIEELFKIQKEEPGIAEKCHEKIESHKLDMKFVDVELRYDRQKISVFFTSDHRVDFRDLVRDLASEFRVRIQMVQISTRDEAKRMGGIGTCGRLLCCSTWLNEFHQVSTDSAKYQNIQLNMSRLTGQCGRLKCCLNYERDSYSEQLKKFPVLESMVKTEKGKALIEKIDIFREEIWLHYEKSDQWDCMTLDDFNKMFVRQN
jgi:cell fate regulator YaaT (PSP1 superfamily)